MHFQNSAHQGEFEDYKKLIDRVNWFFFELFLLGYVEDHDTGESFHAPEDLGWKFYIEVRLKTVKVLCFPY